MKILYFNTSYVVIKRLGKFKSTIAIRISIHLMLLLNKVEALVVLKVMYFNTSYVVIKRGEIKDVLTLKPEFQYILCCY